jgi:hypothetical protein
MDTRWLKGFDPDQYENRKKEVASHKNAFKLLVELLEKELEDHPVPDYNNPSWAYKQADINGANRKLKEIIKLITIKD